jgi:hypothetical protein
MTDEVSHDPTATTVQDALANAGARVSGGKLYDSSGREIYFYVYHTGGPIPNPEEEAKLAARAREREREVNELRQRYTVIVVHQPVP